MLMLWRSYFLMIVLFVVAISTNLNGQLFDLSNTRHMMPKVEYNEGWPICQCRTFVK